MSKETWTPERMAEAGWKSKSLFWSDKELDDQISALMLVLNYLEGRGDCAIVLSALRSDLNKFQMISDARKKEHQLNR